MDLPDPVPAVSRRTLLAAVALGTSAIAAGCAEIVLPRAVETPRVKPSPVQPDPSPTRTASPGPVVYGTLRSPATGSVEQWVICYPPGTKPGAHLPVVIALHGMGDTIYNLDLLQYPSFLAQAVANGATPFAIAAINGQTLFWEKKGRQDGGALVATDFVGLLKRRGLDTSRLALTGWSMGGWGTLRLACDELHGKLRAAAALSTPCYAKLSDAPETGWMTQQQFDANNFFDRTDRLTNLPIFLACGMQDAFFDGNVVFADRLANTPGVIRPVTDFRPGGHDPNLWRSVAPAQFRFLASYL